MPTRIRVERVFLAMLCVQEAFPKAIELKERSKADMRIQGVVISYLHRNEKSDLPEK